MKKNSFLLALALLLSGIGIASFASTDQPTSTVAVCVDWTTKVVKYSKAWEKCPPKTTKIELGKEGEPGAAGPAGPQGVPGLTGATGATGATGPRGASGSSTSFWDSFSNCNMKLGVAKSAGYYLPVKTNRDSFESASGCIVENSWKSERQAAIDAGLPAIVDIQLHDITDQCVLIDYQNRGWLGNSAWCVAHYDLSIVNLDSLSSIANMPIKPCAPSTNVSDSRITDLGNGDYRYRTIIRGDGGGLFAEIRIGYWFNGRCNYYLDYMQAFIDEDPAELSAALSGSVVDTYWSDLLSQWGW